MRVEEKKKKMITLRIVREKGVQTPPPESVPFIIIFFIHFENPRIVFSLWRYLVAEYFSISYARP